VTRRLIYWHPPPLHGGSYQAHAREDSADSLPGREKSARNS